MILFLYLPQEIGAAIDKFIKKKVKTVLFYLWLILFSNSVVYSGSTIIFGRFGSASFEYVV